jgi:hypothetical protein
MVDDKGEEGGLSERAVATTRGEETVLGLDDRRVASATAEYSLWSSRLLRDLGR